jgi:hypothetical protein
MVYKCHSDYQSLIRRNLVHPNIIGFYGTTSDTEMPLIVCANATRKKQSIYCVRV